MSEEDISDKETSFVNFQGLKNDDLQHNVQPSNQVYVRNIPKVFSSNAFLRKLFGKIEGMEECFIAGTDAYTKCSFGFVTYKSFQSALEAIKNYDNMDLGDGVALGVKIAKCRDKKIRSFKGPDKTEGTGNLPNTFCEICGKKSSFKCNNCQRIYYCSIECQQKDWCKHQKSCSTSFVPIVYGEIAHAKQATPIVITFGPHEIFVTHVDGEQFYAVLALPSTTEKLKSIAETLFNTAKENQKIFEISKDILYSAPLADHQRARVSIFKIVNQETVNVSYIDYGKKCDIPINEILPINSEEICSYPEQAFCCTFKEPKDKEKLLAAMNKSPNNSILLSVLSFKDGIYTVAIGAIEERVTKTIQTIALVPGEIYNIIVMCKMEGGEIRIRLNDDFSLLLYKAIQSFLGSLANKFITSESYDIDELVLFKLQGGMMKRAKIISKAPNGVYYFLLIDSGRYSKSYASCFCKMPSSLKIIPPLAYLCKVDAESQLPGSKKSINISHINMPNYVYEMKVLEIKENIPIVTLLSEIETHPSTNNNLSIDAEMEIINMSLCSINDYKEISVPVGADIHVIVSYFISPKEFYVQLVRGDYKRPFEEMMSIIESEMEMETKEKAINFNPIIGSPVLCKDPAGGWFRALVTNVKNQTKQYCVKYIDFGNSDVISIQNIVPIDPKYFKYPMYAIRCCLEEDNFVDKVKSGLENPIKLVVVNINTDKSLIVKIL